MTSTFLGRLALFTAFATLAIFLFGCEYTETITDPNGETYQVPVRVTIN